MSDLNLWGVETQTVVLKMEPITEETFREAVMEAIKNERSHQPYQYIMSQAEYDFWMKQESLRK